VDTIERSTPKSKADRSNIIETRYRHKETAYSGIVDDARMSICSEQHRRLLITRQIVISLT